MKKNSKAKLIWTVTHAGCKKLGIEAIASTIVENNLNAVRMNFYPAAADNIIELQEKISKHPSKRDKNSSVAFNIPFLLSFVGRKALLSVPAGELNVATNSSISIEFIEDFVACASNNIQNSQDNKIEIQLSSRDQIQNLKEGSFISISYGSVELKVLEIVARRTEATTVNCLVVNGGVLYTGMDVHSPDMSQDLFPLLEDDNKTLHSSFMNLADFVLVDGIKSAEEFMTIKHAIIGKENHISERHPSIGISKKIREKDAQLPPRFLLKIDSTRSLELLNSLMKHVDGIFLSRSELGIDEHPHSLAIIQKELVSLCNKNSKVIIIASELMHSMRTNANPTRAEVSDMANAAADGADALVLSHEITEGPNADLVAQVCFETLVNSEAWEEKKWLSLEVEQILNDDDAVTYGAIRIAEQAGVRGIACFTEGGYTAMKLSAMRTPAEIIAITFNKKIMRQMNLLRSVTAMTLESHSKMESIISETKDILVKHFNYKKGEKFVFVSLTASSVAQRNSNLFTLQEID